MYRMLVVNALALVLFCSIVHGGAHSCREPFQNKIREQRLDKCYFLAGESDTFLAAPLVCAGFGALVFTLDHPDAFGDLYKIYKNGPYYFHWLGATANTSFPKSFFWQNGEPVHNDLWCSGHPKGDIDHLCTYYSGMPVMGDKHCIYSGSCRAKFFKHGIICEDHRVNTTEISEETEVETETETEKIPYIEESEILPTEGISSAEIGDNQVEDKDSPVLPNTANSKFSSMFNNRCVCDGCTDIMHNDALCKFCCLSLLN